MKEQHITFEASVAGNGQVTLNKVIETPPEYKGNHDLVVDARDRRYYVRITGEGGWTLAERIRHEAIEAAKNEIEARDPLRD